MDQILTLNAGSSSIKFSLFGVTGPDHLKLVAHGGVEGIGSAPRFVAKNPADAVLAEHSWSDPDQGFPSLMDAVLRWVETQLDDARLIAAGHRVVHGGPDHDRPERVTPDLLAALDRLAPLAPLHQPHNLVPIRAIAASRPRLPQVTCFDTAFHHAMPAVATRFALPRRYEAEGVRRYGFHGLSYEYVTRRLRELDPNLADGRLIVAHLGNGASLCAVHRGRSVDTTMGLTALDGLVMGTRCGNLDPGVILYLAQACSMTMPKIEDLLYRQSGLLGVSGGIAGDMRTLQASTDPRAREAIELFVYRIAREAGALASSLGGLDGLVFTAGIGERAPTIREQACARLAWLGVALDRDANVENAAVISTPQSRVVVRVIPTDEEWMIAYHTLNTMGRTADGDRG